MGFAGAADGQVFRTNVRDMLAPTWSPGDIVVMDNLTAHKEQGMRKAIEIVGADLWYLPPYPPSA